MTNVIEILKQADALILNDHIVGTSGRHLEGYINKDALFMHTTLASKMGKLFADKLANLRIDIVAGPAVGGIILAQWTAFHLTHQEGRNILSVFAEKKDGDLIFKRGYDHKIRGKNIAVVEDATTTGGSLKKVVDSAQNAGAVVVATSVMVNRDPARVTEKMFGVPFYPLIEFDIASYSEKECPLCKAGVPINTTVGHGAQYVREKNL
jgi:orotate phosphoribosyltransferase